MMKIKFDEFVKFDKFLVSKRLQSAIGRFLGKFVSRTVLPKYRQYHKLERQTIKKKKKWPHNMNSNKNHQKTIKSILFYI